MRKLNTKTITAIVANCLLCLVFQSCFFGYEVKEGHFWVKEYEIDNPYENARRDTVYILEVNGEYCKYIRYGDTMSTKRFWIPVNGRLIK